MHIKKQRLLTPGPTPLYPQALHAMMASDIHHRTEDFRKVYRRARRPERSVGDTRTTFCRWSPPGTGAMEASVSNFFSRGDKVIVCSAGKFGERWAEIAKAYGLDAMCSPRNTAMSSAPTRSPTRLKKDSGYKGVFVQASETSTGAAHDVQGMAAAIKKTDASVRGRRHHRPRHQPLDIDGWGLDVVIGGSQKAFMIPPGLAFLSVSPKAWKLAETANLPHYYFNLKKEKKKRQAGESSWTPNTSLILALGEALKYVKSIGMAKLIENAQLLARGNARSRRQNLGLNCSRRTPRARRSPRSARRRAWIPASS